MVYVYLIKSNQNASYYTGISKNVEKRVFEHNSGKLKTTSTLKPWKLVYWKEHSDYGEARKHESWLKKKNREYKDKLSLPRLT